MRKKMSWGLAALVCAAGTITMYGQEAQTIAPVVVSAAAPMPRVVRYSGTVDVQPGTSVTLKFSLYENQGGGSPVWTEMQKVTPDSAGKYSVLLGAATENGLPQNVFSAAQAKWLGVTVGEGQEQVRTILVATPYSLKASDSETLGGHPASDFVLSKSKALPASGTNITQINVTNGVTGGGTGPTVTLGLSSTYLENLGNEIYPQLTGTNTLTGKNTYTAGKLLLGTSPVLSAANVTGTSPVTATVSGNTVKIGLSDSALLTLGDSVYAQLGAANTFTNTNTINGSAVGNFTTAINSTGQLTVNDTNTSGFAISANSGLIGVEGGGIVGMQGLAPTVDEAGIITGSSIGVAGFGGTGVYGETTYTGNDVYASGVEGYVPTSYSGEYYAFGVYGVDQSSAGLAYAAYGYSAENPGVVGETGSGSFGVWGYNDNTTGTGEGVRGFSSSAAGFGVHGVGAGASATGATLLSEGTYGAGVWGDSSESNFYNYGGVFGTGDDSTGGFFVNNSGTSGTDSSTVYALNMDGSGSTYNAAHVFTAVGRNGACGINTSGDVTCSGQLKTALPVAGGAQHVDVYSVQSSENWVEDFGSAKLENGRVTVPIDQQFARIVNTGVQYHVFLTPRGDCDTLFVANAGSSGFEVQEAKGGRSSVEFDYRIVAKRSGFETERLADATAEMHSLTHRRDEMLEKMRTNVARPAETKNSRPPGMNQLKNRPTGKRRMGAVLLPAAKPLVHTSPK